MYLLRQAQATQPDLNPQNTCRVNGKVSPIGNVVPNTLHEHQPSGTTRKRSARSMTAATTNENQRPNNISLDRSDVLLDSIHDALSKSPYLTRKLVHCEEAEGRVVVKGKVGTYFQKQMATEVLRNLDGVEQIENRLEVVWR